ncbi:MAG: DoxX family membrane protein [Desulfamplus sp.]|nr:DoxX family membrane protein [Desulfamplus sp.]
MLFDVLRIFMGVIFIYASYDKILNPEAFAKAVYNYQIMPDFTINIVALWLPCLEFLIGLCLITGTWLHGATTISTSLMIIFICVMLFNLSRGLNISCGCFSTQTTQDTIGAITILRDIAFLLSSLYLTLWLFFFSKSQDA